MAKLKRRIVIEEYEICDYCKSEVDELKDDHYIMVIINSQEQKFGICEICYDAITRRLVEQATQVLKSSPPPPPQEEAPENETQASASSPKKKRKKAIKKVAKKKDKKAFIDPADRLDLSQKNDTKVNTSVVTDDEGNERVVYDVVPGKALNQILSAANAVTPDQAKDSANYDAAEAYADGDEGMMWDPVLRCFKFPVDITRGEARRKMIQRRDEQKDAIDRIATKRSSNAIRIRSEG